MYLVLGVTQSLAAVYIEIVMDYGEKKKWTALQLKPRTTALRILKGASMSWRCSCFMWPKQKWLLVHYFWIRKKIKSQCSSFTSDKPGCFSARAELDAMFFACVFCCFLHFASWSLCSAICSRECCLFMRKTCLSLKLSHRCPLSLVPVLPYRGLFHSPRKPTDSTHRSCYMRLKLY